MWNALLIKFGFFILHTGASMLVKRVFGKEANQHLEEIVKELSLDGDLTGKQKYNRAKKYLDGVSTGVPETVKNIVIEAAVSKVTGKAGAFLKKVR